MPDNTAKTPAPTAREIRDRIAIRDCPNQRQVGNNEIIIFHASGKKIRITVKELED